MTVDDKLIDQIVRDVVQQLRTAASPAASLGREDSPEPTIGESGRESNGLMLNDAVITEELLKQRAGGQRRIEIGSHSVLTPSARDFLRNRGIECDRRQSDLSHPTAGSCWLAVIVRSSPHVATALDDVERTLGLRWRREIVGAETEAVQLGVGALCRADVAGAVLFAESTEAVACRANRNRRVRAAAVSDVPSLRRVKARMGVNLICIDPTVKSYFELRNILRELATGEPPQVPGDWDESP